MERPAIITVSDRLARILLHEIRAKKLPATKLIVSAIVPARNEEENIAASVESLAAQAEIAEIIVVNDQSDGSDRRDIGRVGGADSETCM